MILKYAPSLVVNTGAAGGVGPEIRIGDLVVASACVQHDMDTSPIGFLRGQIPFSDWRFLKTASHLLEVAQGFTPAAGKVHTGRICTGDQFITHREMASHSYLTEELAGDAVEMEGASVAQVCHVNEVPFLVARTISDKADGSAAISFEEFLPRASLNSLDFVRFMLAQIK